VVAIEDALARIAYLITRVRRHQLIREATGVPLDRAAVVILRNLAESDAVRPGEVAARLEVEAPHVTRQIQRLQEVGYVESGPDRQDGRAQLVRLTAAGRAAADRIRKVSLTAMDAALADWPDVDRHQLAVLFPRMVDDYLDFAASQEHQPPPSGRTTVA
jgi:DNA-binding MarR family transcriptional regulator